jgi:hypothetical protein
MPDIINLRRARKAKTRADREAKAAENRVRHGRTKAAKAEAAGSAALEAARLDAHRRVRPADDDEA